jgi:2'-hydroxyisoflavone reductase
MRALVIGGTRFVGRAVVERLLAAGHDVTLLNRGETNPELFAGVERITTERQAISPSLLGGRTWDAVLDMNAYFPTEIEAAVAALRGRTTRYVMCSTCSVYPSLRPYPLREDGPLTACTAEQAADTSMATYGARKAECERQLLALAPDAGLSVFIGRPVLVYGPHDYTDRVHFWIEAVRRGKVVLPGDGQSIFHTIYAPDLARLFVSMAEADDSRAGTYNAGAIELFTLAQLVSDLTTLLGTTPEIVHVPPELLLSRGVRPQFDLPLWFDEGHVIADVSRAQERLGFRSALLAESLCATVDAYLAQPRIPLDTVTDPDQLWELANRT